MYQESMFSPIFTRLSELRKDDSGQVMPFTAVFSLFLIVIWLTVYNVGVGVTDKIRLQDVADQVAYSQAIVGARAMNLIALNNRTMVANLVSYTTSVIMRSHSKFIRDLTIILYGILYLLSLIPIPVVQQIIQILAAVAYAIDILANLYDTATFGGALIWRFILNFQIVWVLIPATKLMFTSFATLPVFNLAEYQGAVVFKELTNEEKDAEDDSIELWSHFGGRRLITSGFDSLIGGSGTGSFSSASGFVMDVAALAMQVVSWTSWDALIELPGSDDDGDGFLNFLHLTGAPDAADPENSAFSIGDDDISQQRRLQWIVAATYPLSDRESPIFGVEVSGGGMDQATLDRISQLREEADELEEEAEDLEDEAEDLRDEASDLRDEANDLRNQDPPDTAGADAKDAQAQAKEDQAQAKEDQAQAKRDQAQANRDEADQLQSDAQNSDPEDIDVGATIGNLLGMNEQRWGFNRDPIGSGLLSSTLVIPYTIFANAYCLAVHLSPARVSLEFGGETRVGPYDEQRIWQGDAFGFSGDVYEPRLDFLFPMMPSFGFLGPPYTRNRFSSGEHEEVPDYTEQFEIVAYDFFEVEVEYIDWDPWPSWEREDDISIDFGEAAFSSKLELPGYHWLIEYNIIPAQKAFYDSIWEDAPGFNGNSPKIWRGLFHEGNAEYNDFFTGLGFLSSASSFLSKAGVVFTPQGYLEVDEKHYKDTYADMFALAYHYERQRGENIEQRKGKYYTMVGKEYKSMRLLRWLGLLDAAGAYTTDLPGHSSSTEVMFNGNSGDFEQDLGDDPDRNYGSYQNAANVEGSREFEPHFFGHMVAIAKSEVFYERDNRRTEIPNLFNAFWRARLAPLQTDVAGFLGKLGLGSELSQAFTFFLTH